MPGQPARCKECGFEAIVPEGTLPHKEGAAVAPKDAPSSMVAKAPSVSGPALLSPFAFLAGLSGLATFYMADLYFPVILSLAGIALGFYAYGKVEHATQPLVGGVLGIAGLVLGIVYSVAA